MLSSVAGKRHSASRGITFEFGGQKDKKFASNNDKKSVGFHHVIEGEKLLKNAREILDKKSIENNNSNLLNFGNNSSSAIGFKILAQEYEDMAKRMGA